MKITDAFTYEQKSLIAIYNPGRGRNAVISELVTIHDMSDIDIQPLIEETIALLSVMSDEVFSEAAAGIELESGDYLASITHDPKGRSL